MSSNDFIAISKSSFTVTHRDADTGEELSEIGQSKTLEEAIEIAEKWQDDTGFYVEYGIKFIE